MTGKPEIDITKIDCRPDPGMVAFQHRLTTDHISREIDGHRIEIERLRGIRREMIVAWRKNKRKGGK